MVTTTMLTEYKVIREFESTGFGTALTLAATRSWCMMGNHTVTVTLDGQGYVYTAVMMRCVPKEST